MSVLRSELFKGAHMKNFISRISLLSFVICLFQLGLPVEAAADQPNWDRTIATARAKAFLASNIVFKDSIYCDYESTNLCIRILTFADTQNFLYQSCVPGANRAKSDFFFAKEESSEYTVAIDQTKNGELKIDYIPPVTNYYEASGVTEVGNLTEIKMDEYDGGTDERIFTTISIGVFSVQTTVTYGDANDEEYYEFLRVDQDAEPIDCFEQLPLKFE